MRPSSKAPRRITSTRASPTNSGWRNAKWISYSASSHFKSNLTSERAGFVGMLFNHSRKQVSVWNEAGLLQCAARSNVGGIATRGGNRAELVSGTFQFLHEV